MQILDYSPEIQTYSNDDGHFITGFLIGTKLNDAKWAINKEKGHDLIQKFVGKDFAIIPELIKKPLSQGGGGHYFGLDTKEDILKGYADHSHGKITRVKGPYSYNDGTDDYFYNFDIKLRDSKAASALVEHGANTWEPFSVSPHIWPLEGPDHNYTRWDPLGVALVIKGAYGPQAVISKMCKGPAVKCEKSMGASITCEKEDEEIVQIFSSLFSKSASTQHMENTPPSTDTSKVIETPKVTEITKTNTTVDPQTAITHQSSRVVTPEEFDKVQTDLANKEKQLAILLEKDRRNTLTNLFGPIKDEKARKELIEEYMKDKEVNVDQLSNILAKVIPLFKASEQPEEPKSEEKKEETKAKSKSASLPAEPELPKEEPGSRAAQVPVNKVKEIANFILGGS